MRILIGLLCCLIPFAVHAQQLRFNASSANIDSFPLVRFAITVNENGSIPTPPLTASDFTITEDGQAVTPQLSDCDDSRSAAVVICIDHSTSMIGSAGDSWNIYPSFLDSFLDLISNLRPQSKYALLPFTEKSDDLYPQPPNPAFYSAQVPADEAAAMSVIQGLQFAGGTDVDKALFKAASVLEYSGLTTKAIVLVTDEFIKFPDSVLTELQRVGIMLCVFQAGSDFTKYSFDVAQATGGLYFQVGDTAMYNDVMLEIAEHLSSEHCTLSYLSPHPCPWYKTHQVSLTLTRGAMTRNILSSFTLGRNVNDKTPPVLTAIAPTYTTRRVTAAGNFPCERGLKDFRDSLRQNIGIFQRTRTFPSLASDSLRVQDTMANAKAVYVAIDSANNRSVLEVLYAPQPDTLDPVIVLTSSTGGKYRALISETRGWDRGLLSASLVPGAINLVFDSVNFYSKAMGQMWFHQPDPLAVSNGCIEVQDSVGNIATYCIDRSGPAGDTLPPVIVQNPIVQPRVQVDASISELRPNDRGIKQVAASSLVNFANPQTFYTNARQATLRVALLDSLTPAIGVVSASDSADNVSLDTLRYVPLPDIAAPTCAVETVDVSTRKFKTTELIAWDRGIRDVTIIGSPTNLSVGPLVFVDRFRAEQTFALIDNTQAGSVAIRSRDSVGHECLTTIDIPPSEAPPVPLLPFQHAAVLDFGKVFAVGDVTLPLAIKNPNDRTVVVTKLSLTGDTEFSVVNGGTPFFFGPQETKSIDIRYQPALLGIHRTKLTLGNDTMQLAQADIIGQSIGRVRLSLDAVSVNAPEETGVLHMSIDATPNPINLDTISFTIAYDRDVALLDPQLPDCGGNNPLCEYTVTYSGDPEAGAIDVRLIRSNLSRTSAIVSSTAKIDIPFMTFLAREPKTDVTFASPFVSQESVVTSDTGSITVGSDGCGFEILRAFLRTNTISIQSIKPNPSATMSEVTAYVPEPSTVTLAVYDTKGLNVMQKTMKLSTGEQKIGLNTAFLPNGSYTLTLTTASGFSTARLMVNR